MKINDLLNIKSNYDKTEKKIILSFLFNCKINDLYLIKEIDNKIIRKYQKLIKSNLPVQYLLKNANFLDNNFYVNKDVLIPRFETEQLVIDTNELINKYFKKTASIIDIGTGSGAIAISLKKLNENNNVTATDISTKALKVASKNAKILDTEIKFIKSDMLENINNKYDVLISNPPYLYEDATHIEEKVIKYEPHLALFGGLKYYEIILKEASRVLNKQSIIAFEIGYNQKEDINKLVNKYFPNSKIINRKDLNHFDRYIYIVNNFE